MKAKKKKSTDPYMNSPKNSMSKQGDPLSATLFRIAMDSILKKMELRGNISTRLQQCTAYTDDILITTRTTQAMIDIRKIEK